MSVPLKRYVVMPDAHVPYHDQSSWRVILRAIEAVKPDGFICIGDFVEGEAVSHWKWKRRTKPPLEFLLNDINEEIVTCNDWWDDLDEVLDKHNVKDKIFIQGNHDAWYDHMVEEYPFLASTTHLKGIGYLFKDAFKLKERGYNFVDIGKLHRIGKLNFYHGHHYGGIAHARNHLLKMGVNVMYGHYHEIQEYSLTHADGPKGAWCIGTIKGLEHEQANEWLQRRLTNWVQGFAIVDFFDGGLFTVETKRIIQGKCSLWGNIITGTRRG